MSCGQHDEHDEPGVLEHGLHHLQGSSGVGAGVSKGIGVSFGVSFGFGSFVGDGIGARTISTPRAAFLCPDTSAATARAESTKTIRVAKVRMLRLFIG